MAWTVTILNPDGTTHATGTVTLNGPGGVTIPTQDWSCGYPHQLKGYQTDAGKLSGTVVNPWPDPVHAGESQGQDPDPTGPSWEASGTDPGPHE